MALEKLRSSFTTKATAAGLAGFLALSPMTGKAQDATNIAMPNDCGVMSAEICELDNMADAAREYATDNQSVAILFHIGDDIRARADGEELMQRAEAFFTQQFAEHGIEIETFSRTNLNAAATGLTYYNGHLIHSIDDNGERRINLDLKEGIDSIPEVVIQLGILRQMAELQPEDAPVPAEGG